MHRRGVRPAARRRRVQPLPAPLPADAARRHRDGRHAAADGRVRRAHGARQRVQEASQILPDVGPRDEQVRERDVRPDARHHVVERDEGAGRRRTVVVPDEISVELLENTILRRIMSDYIKAGKQILKTKSKKSPAMSQKWRDFVVEKLGAEEDDEKRSKGQLIIKLENMSEVDLVSLFVSLCKGKVSNPISAILKNPGWEPALKDQMTAFSGSDIDPKGGLEFRTYITDALGLDEDAPPGEEENPLIMAINDLTNKDMDNLYEMIRPKKSRQGKKPFAV